MVGIRSFSVGIQPIFRDDLWVSGRVMVFRSRSSHFHNQQQDYRNLCDGKTHQANLQEECDFTVLWNFKNSNFWRMWFWLEMMESVAKKQHHPKLIPLGLTWWFWLKVQHKKHKLHRHFHPTFFLPARDMAFIVLRSKICTFCLWSAVFFCSSWQILSETCRPFPKKLEKSIH